MSPHAAALMKSGENDIADDGPEHAPEAEVAAMRQRLRTAAHEIRTPLTGASAIIDILAASAIGDGPTRDYILLLKDAVAQTVAITNDILDLGRLEADLGLGPREALSPLGLLTSITNLARPRAEARGLSVTLEAGNLPPRLIAHPVLIRRAIENLLDNAVKHTRSGGIILYASVDDDQILRIDVADTGPGIAIADLPRLFEPYVQLAGGERAGGTGLGLALVRAAIERAGGTVSVESVVGRGSTFHVAVPVERAQDIAPAAPTTGNARRPLSILVAEDNPVNRIVAAAILGEFGHRVTFATDGYDALEAMRKSRYDLVLMDIEMPGLDGKAGLTAIRALPDISRATPVIALSANGQDSRTALLAHGFDGYVIKPIDPAALFATIEDVTG